MGKTFGIFIGSILILGTLGLSQSAFAANYNEMEGEGDPAANNVLANAEHIDSALFTAPEPAGVFPRSNSETATIFGQGGAPSGSSPPATAVTEKVDAQGHDEDVDWYSFTLTGFKIFMADVDDYSGNGGDSQLHLFDANGFPIAFNDDSQEPGATCCDSFIGEIGLGPGTYYIALNDFAEKSNVSIDDCDSTSFLTRPDGDFGGERCVGPPGAADPLIPSASVNPGGGDDYTLHLSLKMSSAVGGEFLGVDSTPLLAAGAQANAAWMIPVIVSAIGIGIVISRKF